MAVHNFQRIKKSLQLNIHKRVHSTMAWKKYQT
jgi:hypothetical protein